MLADSIAVVGHSLVASCATNECDGNVKVNEWQTSSLSIPRMMGIPRKICQRLQLVIEQHAHRVKLASVDDEPDVDLQPFDKIVIGASIRYGKHRPQVYDFIGRNEKVLESKPSAFFSVNVVARKPEKSRPETNPYIRQFQKRTAWRPRGFGSLRRQDRLSEVPLLGPANNKINYVDDERTYRSKSSGGIYQLEGCERIRAACLRDVTGERFMGGTE